MPALPFLFRIATTVAADSDTPVLELRGITKRFPGVLANDHVDLDLRRGEVHALLGENGAGKSTLMNILYGLYRPDEGEILLNGKPAEFSSPHGAIAAGIGMVHQHFMLIPVMTVAENIVLASEPRRNGVLLDTAAAERRVRELAEQFGFHIDPARARPGHHRGSAAARRDPQGAVPAGRHPHPRRADGRADAAGGGRALRDPQRLVAEGMSVIFISHKLNEVLDIADRITVLRRGKKVDTIPREGATEAGLARMMVGREVLLRVDKAASQAGRRAPRRRGPARRSTTAASKPCAASRSRCAPARSSRSPASTATARRELIDAITGLRTPESRDASSSAARDLTHGERARVPRARRRPHPGGPAPARPRARVLARREPRPARLREAAVRDAAASSTSSQIAAYGKRLLTEFDVRGGTPTTRASALSGGNQQKVVIAREVSRDPRVLIAAQPTRGLDVGAIEFVHRRLVEERDEGRAVLLVSLELEEVLSLADRILVIYEGRIVGEFDPSVTEEELGIAMTGGTRGGGGMSERPDDDGSPPDGRAPDGDRAERRGAARVLPARRRDHHAALHGADRVLRGRARRARDRPQPAQDVQGDLGRHRA